MHSIYEFAFKLAALSEDTVRKVLKLDVDLQDKPLLNELFESGEVGWSRIKAVASIVTRENEKELVKKIVTMSNASVEVMVRDYKQENDHMVGIPVNNEVRQESFETFSIKLSAETLGQLRVIKRQLEKEHKQVLTWEASMKLMIQKLKVPEKEFKKTIPIENPSRHIQLGLVREALQKTNGLCANKNCNKPHAHMHHQEAYSESHSHASITPLCKAHHDIEHHKEDTQTNRLYQAYKRKAQGG